MTGVKFWCLVACICHSLVLKLNATSQVPSQPPSMAPLYVDYVPTAPPNRVPLAGYTNSPTIESSMKPTIAPHLAPINSPTDAPGVQHISCVHNNYNNNDNDNNIIDVNDDDDDDGIHQVLDDDDYEEDEEERLEYPSVYEKWGLMYKEDRDALYKSWLNGYQDDNNEDYYLLSIKVFGFTLDEAKSLYIWFKYMNVNDFYEPQELEEEQVEEENANINYGWDIHYDMNMVNSKVKINDISLLGNANTINDAILLATNAGVDMFTWHNTKNRWKGKVYGWTYKIAKQKGRDTVESWIKQGNHVSGIKHNYNNQ